MKQQKSGSDIILKIFKYKKIAALLAGAAILFSGCEKEIERIEAFKSTENLPILMATDFETTYTDSFKVQFYMKSPLIQKFETEGQPFMEFPKGILIIKYDPSGTIVSHITADYAKQFEKEQKWEAKNNVVAINTQGDTLKTEHLIWDEKGGKIYSDKFVKIIHPDRVISGFGFESDQNMKNLNIKNVTGLIYLNVEKQDPTLESSPGTTPQTPGEHPDSLKFY
jgi:LPS export ABC transporter protein LptC